MKLNQVAAQLYTLRDYLKTPQDIAASLKRVREIGYEAVQVSGMGPIPENELIKITQDNGLIICATHESGETILHNPEAVIERLDKLHCRHTAFPHPGSIDYTDSSAVERLIDGLDKSGETLAAAGKTLSYHNHAIEFIKVNGRTLLETIYARTNPKHLHAELDTYWIQYGGGDPVAWCTSLRNRLPVLHLKDYRFTPENKPTFAEIGSGTLNFSAIVREAEASGCEWFIVEQDTCPGDPFDSLEQSFAYIKAHLVS